jgi:hypothetical protein
MNSVLRNATWPTRTKSCDGEQACASDETILVAAVDRLLLLMGTALAAGVIYIVFSE